MKVAAKLKRHVFWTSMVLGGAALLLLNGPMRLCTARAAQPKILLETNALTRDAKAISSFAPVVKKVTPSVVTVYSTKVVREELVNSPLFNDPFFRRFFGMDDDDNTPGHRPRQHQEQGLGSGVIVSSNGYILSNNHVVENADEVKVSLADGTEYIAKVVGTDPPTDISVLKVEATNLAPITMTDSANSQVGDVVLAVGNPFGVGQTVTMGIISGVGRGGFGIVDYEDFIQTDASINPGNSGGALVDAEGRLVGLNTAIMSRTGGNMGIGFAVPVNIARTIMERIIRDGRVVRGYLGVYVQQLTPQLAKEFKMSDRAGALVSGVAPKSPAAEAGLQEGDVVVEMNGAKIKDSRSLRFLIAQTAPNTKVDLKALRDGKERNVTATLGELPVEPKTASTENERPPSGRKTEGLLGVEVADLDARWRRQLEIPTDVRGAMVLNVDRDSPAYAAGIRQGDVILEINRQKIRDARDAVELSRKLKEARALLRVWSKGATRYAVVESAKKP